jgi:propanol-preferring alcohol dehydrogenase
MKDTYKAVEVYEPGKLRVVERPVAEPRAGQVRIRVEACGICHTDAATVMGIYPGLTLPRVPGHEVVGCIEALGSGVVIGHGYSLQKSVLAFPGASFPST